MPTDGSAQYKKQRMIFDDEFKNYEEYSLENWRISYINRIFEGLDIKSNNLDYTDIFLDIGVGGSGYTVIEAAKEGCRSIGIDLSLKGIKKAKLFADKILDVRVRELCSFVVCSADYLPFKSKTFSKVSCIMVLEHISDDELVIKEVSRITRPTGKIFFSVPNTYQRILPIFWVHYYILDRKVGHLRHYKAEDLIGEFSKYGFILQDIRYSAHFTKIIQILLSKLFPQLEKRSSKIWWKLEKLDLKLRKVPMGFSISLIMIKE